MASAILEKLLRENAPKGIFAPAAMETIEYAAGIVKDPRRCPMFPYINEHNGFGEAVCYMHGYLAGRIASTGKTPTKEEMDSLRFTVLHDPRVRDIVLGMQKSTEPNPEGLALREY